MLIPVVNKFPVNNQYDLMSTSEVHFCWTQRGFEINANEYSNMLMFSSYMFAYSTSLLSVLACIRLVSRAACAIKLRLTGI